MSFVSQQSEFQFEAAQTDGYQRWTELRRAAAVELAKRCNMPLGHSVEVWLRGGVRLRGVLRLKEELLFTEDDQLNKLEFVVDGVPFTMDHLDSCVRTDA